MPTRRTFLAVPLTLAAQSILDLPPARPGDRIAYGADEFQFGELRVPSGAGPYPVAIIIHGGYWRAQYDLAHIGHFCEALTRDGIATWSLEYRRLGNPGGGFPGTFDDVAAGARHLKKIAAGHRLDLDRVVATGHSAGGQLVLWLAKRRVVNLTRVVPLAPVADLRRAFELHLSDTVVADLLGGPPAQVPDRYHSTSPIELVPLGIEQRLIHGLNDNVVPISLSRDYVTAARSRGDDSTLTEVPGAGHFELIDPRSAAWEVVKKAIARG